MRNIIPLDAITPADDWHSAERASSRVAETEWARANIAEVLPHLASPQALAALEELLNQAERRYLGRLMAPEDELGPMVTSFGGRLYFNLSQLRRVCVLGRVAPAVMLRSIAYPVAIDRDDERTPRWTIRRLSCAPDLIRILWRHLRAARLIHEHEVSTARYLTRLAAFDPRRLSDFELWSVVEQWFGEAPAYLQTLLLVSDARFHEASVRRICEKVGFPCEQLVYPYLAAGERTIRAQQAFDLVALAGVARRDPRVVRYLLDPAHDVSQLRTALRGTAFLAALEHFLEDYGHRARYEYDWSLARFSEDLAPLFDAIREYVQADSETDVSATVEQQAGEAANSWKAFEQRLSPWGRWITVPRIRRSIRWMKRYDIWREQVRSDLVRVLGALRGWHLALAERFVERGWLDNQDDYFLLRFREIAAIVSGQAGSDMLRAIVTERIAERARFRSMSMPVVMRRPRSAGSS